MFKFIRYFSRKFSHSEESLTIITRNSFRYEPKGLPLVFLSKGKMYQNSKSAVLPRFRAISPDIQRPLVDAVVIDLAHLLYKCVERAGVKIIENLFNVSLLLLS